MIDGAEAACETVVDKMNHTLIVKIYSSVKSEIELVITGEQLSLDEDEYLGKQ